MKITFDIDIPECLLPDVSIMLLSALEQPPPNPNPLATWRWTAAKLVVRWLKGNIDKAITEVTLRDWKPIPPPRD